MKARDVAFSALFAALTAVGAQIAIPLGPVPFTLQVLVIFLSALILGARLGFLSQFIYVLMGAIGLPVFARFSGGFVHIYGPTGGYIIAFPIAAFLIGFIAEKREGLVWHLTACLLGLTVIYLLGWLRLGFYMGGDFVKAFKLGVAPFVVFDVIKAFLAVVIGDKVKKAVKI
jgi:biotin transport system substrate-specific component